MASTGSIAPLTSRRTALSPAGTTSDAGERRQCRRSASERHLERLRSEVTKLRQGPLVDQPSGTQDPDAVAHRLDLAEDVRRQEHRLAAPLRFVDTGAKRHLHERVESARWLIEDEQVGPARKRGHQLDLLAVSLRQRPHLPVHVELEPFDELVAYMRSVPPRRRAKYSSVSAAVSDGQRAGSPDT